MHLVNWNLLESQCEFIPSISFIVNVEPFRWNGLTCLLVQSKYRESVSSWSSHRTILINRLKDKLASLSCIKISINDFTRGKGFVRMSWAHQNFEEFSAWSNLGYFFLLKCREESRLRRCSLSCDVHWLDTPIVDTTRWIKSKGLTLWADHILNFFVS